MKGLVLSVAIVLVCVSLMGALTLAATGFDHTDFKPHTLKELLIYFGNDTLDMSFDKTRIMIKDIENILGGLDSYIKECEEFISGTEDGLQAVIAMFLWLVLWTAQIFNILVSLVSIVVILVVDLLEIIVWIFNVVTWLVTLQPIK